MTAYFLDSSACVKLCVEEVGSGWLRELVSRAPQHEFWIVRITVVETTAALYRRAHRLTHNLTEAQAAANLLQRDVEGLFRVIEISPVLVSIALEVAVRRGLRGYDCVQLAGGLLARRVPTESRPPGLSGVRFVSSDRELQYAARAYYDDDWIEDPNSH